MKLSTIYKNFGSIAQKLRSVQLFLFWEIFPHILDRIGPDLNAINLKFLQIVGHEVFYSM